jgi:hypothetical protein
VRQAQAAGHTTVPQIDDCDGPHSGENDKRRNAERYAGALSQGPLYG